MLNEGPTDASSPKYVAVFNISFNLSYLLKMVPCSSESLKRAKPKGKY